MNRDDNKLDRFLNDELAQQCENDGNCVIKTDKSLIERINKKIITEDGKELLI